MIVNDHRARPLRGFLGQLADYIFGDELAISDVVILYEFCVSFRLRWFRLGRAELDGRISQFVARRQLKPGDDPADKRFMIFRLVALIKADGDDEEKVKERERLYRLRLKETTEYLETDFIDVRDLLREVQRLGVPVGVNAPFGVRPLPMS